MAGLRYTPGQDIPIWGKEVVVIFVDVVIDDVVDNVVVVIIVDGLV